MPEFPHLRPGLLRGLRRLLGADAVRADRAARETYGRDETEDLFRPPAAVLLPRDASEVAAVLRFASAERLPVTPRGGGTGLSGGALPAPGGLVLSLERLDRIRRLDLRSQLVEVEAGVVTADLHRRVEASGLFYPPDPGSRETCQIGGNIAEDAGGPRSCKYGTTRRYVLALEIVLADGTLLRTGGDNRKDAAGYDLTQLLVGSEGTLAVVTAAVLRLLPLPPARLTLAAAFSSLEAAADAVVATFAAHREPAACELLERRALELASRLAPAPPQLAEAEAVLLFELDGAGIEPLLAVAADLGSDLEGAGATGLLVATEAADQRRLWTLRRSVAEAVRSSSVYKEADTVVPRRAVADLVRAARRIAARHGIEAVVYGHAADGNLHVNLLRGALPEATWTERRDAAEEELFRAVVELGGSITGEHGVGLTQRRYLPLRLDPAALRLMHAIKAAFDPLGILNPGKVLAPTGASDAR